MPIRRSVNASSRETPPKSKPAEGEEVKAGTVTVLERLMSIQTQAGSETPAKLSQDENIIVWLCFADTVFSLKPLFCILYPVSLQT